MPMPNHLVFIRHGKSEANTVQKGDDHGLEATIASEVFRRPDWRHRLTPEGVEQAKNAKKWLDAELGGVASFDALYVSPFIRTRETAAHLSGDEAVSWTIDDRIVERSWGVYGKRPRAEQRAQFPLTAEEKLANPWYTRLDGGESFPDVYGRVRDFQGTLHREQSGKRVLVVSHGDYMNAVRYGIERMLPEEWERLDEDEEFTLRNLTALEYSRVNPMDPEDVRSKLTWRRYTYPDDIAGSPCGNQWVELAQRRRYTGAELLGQVAISEPLII